MRLAALLLLLANALFLAWGRFAPASASAEPQLIAQQIHPETIKLLSHEQVGALKARSDGPGVDASCLEWGAFGPGELARAQVEAEAIGPRGSVSQKMVEEAAGWWVYLPPQANRQGANQKVAELKRLGIEDYFIVQEEGKLRFAISLGVYRTEEAARARLDQVRGKGARSAAMGIRQTAVHKVYLQLRQWPEDAQSQLSGLRDTHPGTDVRACSA